MSASHCKWGFCWCVFWTIRSEQKYEHRVVYQIDCNFSRSLRSISGRVQKYVREQLPEFCMQKSSVFLLFFNVVSTNVHHSRSWIVSWLAACGPTQCLDPIKFRTFCWIPKGYNRRCPGMSLKHRHRCRH